METGYVATEENAVVDHVHNATPPVYVYVALAVVSV